MTLELENIETQMSFVHNEILQTGQAHPEGSSRGWLISLEVKVKQKKAKKKQMAQVLGRQGFVEYIHAEKPGNGARPGKKKNQREVQDVTVLIDQHFSSKKYRSRKIHHV